MKNALRIGYRLYSDEAAFAAHLKSVENYLYAIDEVTLFTEFSHYGYWDPETVEQTASTVKDRIARYKRIGVKSVGINILSSIGHIEEGYDIFPHADFQYMVNEKGETSKSCLCPAGEDYLRYIANRYAVLADTGADFVWVDDDIRTKNHGIAQYTCFCPTCIAKFNRTYGTDFTREQLCARLSDDTALREKWDITFAQTVQTLLETIGQAVRRVNPAAEIGLMTGPGTVNPEWVLPEWFRASGAVRGRPGGGFYNDISPVSMFVKSFYVQQQLQNYPEQIRDIQYEYEAFNYQSLEKSLHISEMESTLALLSGCNGVLYNNFMFYDRPDLTAMTTHSKRKWDRLTALISNAKNAGVYCANPQEAAQLNEIGIPVTASLEGAVAAYATGKTLALQSAEQIEKILQKHLLTDGYGLEILCKNGFAGACGGRVKRSYSNGMAERFSSHESNGAYREHYRDVFMNFSFESNAYALEPCPGAEILSNLETLRQEPVGCSMYRYASESGAKIVVDGYLMPNQMKTAAKQHQILQAVCWLSGDRLPVMTEKSIKVVPTVMQDRDREMTVMLTNASFDATGSFDCILDGKHTVCFCTEEGDLIPTQPNFSGDRTVVHIENINGWQYVLLTTKNTERKNP